VCAPLNGTARQGLIPAAKHPSVQGSKRELGGQLFFQYPLAEAQYDVDGRLLQDWAAKTYTDAQGHKMSFRLVVLDILSNHGNQAYTCVYRFRVHGQEPPPRAQEEAARSH
jgi:hypothetical protein